jgi:Stage II sporulation protein E (SpoIIE)/GAF domain/Domain of unknown function (DUF4118)
VDRLFRQPPGRSTWDERRPQPARRFVIGTVVGLGAVAAIALGVPETTSKPNIPAGLLILAVALAVIVGGAGSGSLVLAASLGSFLYVFESPHEQFARHHFLDWAAIATMAALGTFVIVAVTVLRRNARLARLERSRLGVLLDVSSRFDQNLDPDAALRETAAAAVPAFADHCVIDLLTADGRGFRRIVAADLDPSTTRFAANLERYPPTAEQRDHPSWRVVESGEPVLISSVSDQERIKASQAPEHLEITRMLDRQSLLYVPIIANGRAIGALTLAHRAASGRRFTKHDIPVGVELGIRAGNALQKAFAHGQLRDAFVEVQRQLLPRRFPLGGGLRLGTQYVPAGAASEVGGDWFAIVPISEERIGLAIGDAVGKGATATAAMARSRFALLALAHRGAEPSDVLSELNSLLFEIRATDMLTVVYGVLDLSRRCWTEARAGHLPTLVRDLDGETRVLESKPGVPLAVLPDAQYGQEDYELGPGSAVVLYTDGLVERRGEVLDVGIDRLRERVRELDTDLDQACAAITGDLVGDAPADDSALLIAQLAADDALD